MTPEQFVSAVDAVIGLPKELVGAAAPEWQRGRDPGERRLKLPLEIAGEQRGLHLFVMAYPDEDFSPTFRLGIMCLEKVVCRIDFEDATHGNNALPHGLPRVVHGPHWHPWELNRRHAGSVLRYDKLPFAIPFTEAQRFDATLRWYCAKRQIALGQHGISFPPREKLL